MKINQTAIRNAAMRSQLYLPPMTEAEASLNRPMVAYADQAAMEKAVRVDLTLFEKIAAFIQDNKILVAAVAGTIVVIGGVIIYKRRRR